jgi:acetyl-CoA C-acetyltransferase
MNKVYIAGIGQTAVGELWERSLANLSAEATLSALHEAGDPAVDALYAGNLLASAASKQANLGTVIATNVGLVGVETFTAEAGEASGAAALRMAYLAVRSGYARTALAVGVEKVTDVVGSRIESLIAQCTDYDFEAMEGMTPVTLAGLLMARYMAQYDVPVDGLSALPLMAHANALHNPYAMYRRAISEEMYRKAGMVSDPLNMFDAAPYADGAAAVLLTSDETIATTSGKALVEVRASAGAVDTLALHDRPDALAFSAVTASTQKALTLADMPLQAMDIYEVWDAFSIYGALSVEATGLAVRGTGWRWLAENRDMPLVTMGGNKARGFPIGAAGVHQAVEAALQLRGEAGQNQVEGAQNAMIQAMGGPAANVITHILARAA